MFKRDGEVEEPRALLCNDRVTNRLGMQRECI
jgi:hypothetical protein